MWHVVRNPEDMLYAAYAAEMVHRGSVPWRDCRVVYHSCSRRLFTVTGLVL